MIWFISFFIQNPIKPFRFHPSKYKFLCNEPVGREKEIKMCKYIIEPCYCFQMGKFKGSSKSSKSATADDENDDALQKVLSNGYTSENEKGLPGRPGRRRMGPMGEYAI